jgi:HAD superfamily hydrolase (TIGR01509 family)
VRAVYFDLYGTLFLPPDPELARRAWVGSCYAELARRGLAMDEAAFEERLLRLWKERPQREPALTPFEGSLTAIAAGLGVRLSAADARSIADTVCGRWQSLMQLDPDAPAALAEAARGRRLGLVSNFDHPRHVRTVLGESGLAPLFDDVIVSGEVGVEKPDPAILTMALARTGLEPAEAAYVGDSIVDFEAARAAGMQPVLIRRPGQTSGDAPAHLARRYGDVEAALAEAAERGELTRIGSLRELPVLFQGGPGLPPRDPSMPQGSRPTGS